MDLSIFQYRQKLNLQLFSLYPSVVPIAVDVSQSFVMLFSFMGFHPKGWFFLSIRSRSLRLKIELYFQQSLSDIWEPPLLVWVIPYVLCFSYADWERFAMMIN
jgi:hypothetical protein